MSRHGSLVVRCGMRYTRRLPQLAAVSGVALVLALAASLAASRPQEPSVESRVDQVFSRWTGSTPGCAVAVGRNGATVLEKAYGMADLEHEARNRANTIFEAGSVSKQFTAAAVLLLARDGKLSLDDPVRKHVPELPDYGAPLTIRHMLNHTSGLRDWGSVASLAGWPRTTRVYTHAHVLDIVSRQHALNFTPGSSWSYCNSGYNLAAIIVSRVSGQPFAEFTRDRLFKPLGMTRTSWRDDHTRIVPGRAIAYAGDGTGGFRIQMPFENVHGNGGLLTTVGDLLRWNENFVSPKVGDRSFVEEQQQPGRFAGGRAHDYALGLFIGAYKGVAEVSHGGATAGYRAFLARYPSQGVSVAVLCNAGSANAEADAHGVADLYLEGALKSAPRVTPASLAIPQLEPLAGMYRDLATGRPMTLVLDKTALRIEGGPPFVPVSGTRFESSQAGVVLEFGQAGQVRMEMANGVIETYERVVPAKPDAAHLAGLAGLYDSDEAEVAFLVVAKGEELRLLRRPGSAYQLRPLYADAFASPLGTVRFIRDAGGKVTAMSVSQDRVWDLRLRRRE